MAREESPRHRRIRLVVVPVCLFLGVSAAVFTLAELSLAKPGAPKVSAGDVTLGDPYRGEIVYSQTCSGCHGSSGQGGVGPRLAGRGLAIGAVKAQIESGGGTMPADLVRGRRLEDILAYVARLVEREGG